MIDIKKYQEDFDKLGINDEKEQLEILNSLLRLAIIMQDNYNPLAELNQRIFDSSNGFVVNKVNIL